MTCLKIKPLIAAASLILLLTPGVSAQGLSASTEQLSPAQQKIALAQIAVGKNPEYVEYHNELASALARRARETTDPLYYGRAEEALQNSFRLAPDNNGGQKIQVQILLGKHEFAKALALAKKLNTRVPDDISVYGFIADAAIELGDYKEAEDAVQWMLDLRHAGAQGLTRIARLRELFGDTAGASEMLYSAYETTGFGETEERARLLTQAARLSLATGDAKSADKLLRQALGLFPEYNYALADLAGVRSAQGRHAEAVELWRRVNRTAPHPRNMYALASALEPAGLIEESKRLYTEFEVQARARTENADNANRELIFYYADHARKPAEALRVARIELVRRRDVHTLDAFAWALYVNGDYREARRQIETALAVGVRDADFLYHAGSIFFKLNDRIRAERHLQQSLDLNPLSASAKSARVTLAHLSSPGARSRSGR